MHQQPSLLFGGQAAAGAIPGIGEALTTPVVLAAPRPAAPAAPAAPLDIFANPEQGVDVDATLARAGGAGGRGLLPEEPRGPMRSGSARHRGREEDRWGGALGAQWSCATVVAAVVAGSYA